MVLLFLASGGRLFLGLQPLSAILRLEQAAGIVGGGAPFQVVMCRPGGVVRRVPPVRLQHDAARFLLLGILGRLN